jgi:hypothetical protein
MNVSTATSVGNDWSKIEVFTLLAYPPYEQGCRGEDWVDVAYISFESEE